MHNLSFVQTFNAAKAPLSSRYALVVGGTSGIGEAIAKNLASLKANVTIVGRNAEAGSRIVEWMKNVNPEGKYEFQSVDLSLMKNIRKFAEEYKNKEKNMDFLVLTQGISSMNGRTETPEGIDIKMAVHYYGRHLFIREMMPLLEQNATEGKDVRVLSVFAAGLGGPVGEDIGLKTSYSLKRCADATSFYGDLMVDKFSTLHPSVTFLHSTPGFVNTPLVHGGNSFLKWLGGLASFTPEECADYMVYTLLADNYKKGYWLLNRKGLLTTKNSKHTEEWREKVWNHTIEETKEK